MERALEAQDRDARADADARFQFSIADLCGNRRLVRLYHALRGQTDRVRSFTLYLRGLPVRSTQKHRRMYECPVEPTAAASETICREHWDRTTDEMLRLIVQHGARDPVRHTWAFPGKDLSGTNTNQGTRNGLQEVHPAWNNWQIPRLIPSRPAGADL